MLIELTSSPELYKELTTQNIYYFVQQETSFPHAQSNRPYETKDIVWENIDSLEGISAPHPK